MIIDENIACPSCHGRDIEILFTVESPDVARHLLNADKIASKEICIQKIEKLWGSKRAAFYFCRECTFEFGYPFISGDEDFYSFVYDAANNYPAEKWEYAQTLTSIKELLKDPAVPARLLELGAGSGKFLGMLKTLIPAGDIYATEFSTAGAKSIGSLGIACLQKDIGKITANDMHGKVSIICMFQVLEHLADIHGFFEKLNELTVPRARLYISVPNYLQRRFFDKHGLHYDLPPVHIGRYNRLSLGLLSESHGWKLVRHLIQPSVYKQRILKFLYSAYAREQQVFNPEKIMIKPVRLFLRYGMYAILSLINIKIILGLTNNNLGVAQWFELEKNT